jgi:hypothetical protein
MTRTTEEITQAHSACLGGADTINVVIATNNLGDSATEDNYGYDMTLEEKKARVSRSVGYLKYQKDNFDDWGDADFTVIDQAITDADTFTGE